MLTPKELAKQLHVTTETVLVWVKTRGLPCHRATRKTLRFNPMEVDLWLSAHRSKSSSPSSNEKNGGAQ
jgi:excisionase family DNA binding protein